MLFSPTILLPTDHVDVAWKLTSSTTLEKCLIFHLFHQPFLHRWVYNCTQITKFQLGNFQFQHWSIFTIFSDAKSTHLHQNKQNNFKKNRESEKLCAVWRFIYDFVPAWFPNQPILGSKQTSIISHNTHDWSFHLWIYTAKRLASYPQKRTTNHSGGKKEMRREQPITLQLWQQPTQGPTKKKPGASKT